MRPRLPDAQGASYASPFPAPSPRRGLARFAVAVLLSLAAHLTLRVVAPTTPRTERSARDVVREPPASEGDLLSKDEVEVAGVTREGDPEKAQGASPSPPPQTTEIEVPPPPPPPTATATPPPTAPPPPTATATPTPIPTAAATATATATAAATARPRGPRPRSSAPKPPGTGDGTGDEEAPQPGEGGGSRAKADKSLLKTMAFELPNYAQALAWGAEATGKYGAVDYLFELDAEGHVTACRPGPKDPKEVPALIATTLERLCKRLARGTYALTSDGLVSRGAQRVVFEVQLSDVPVSDAPADGYAIANRPGGERTGEIEITLVGGRRVVFTWRADAPKLIP